MEFLNKIEKCSLFTDIGSMELIDLLSTINVSVKNYEKDEYIIRRGSFQNCLMILSEGIIESEIVFENGKILKVSEHVAPYVLSASLVHGNEIEYPMDVIARTEVEVIKISKEDVFNMMQSNSIFLKNYLENVAERTTFLYQKLTCFSFRSLREKFILYLLSLSEDQNSDIVKISKSQNELAQSFGVNRPSLAREIRAMHNLGLIMAEGKEIEIISREKLSQMLSCKSNLCTSCLYFDKKRD